MSQLVFIINIKIQFSWEIENYIYMIDTLIAVVKHSIDKYCHTNVENSF